MIFPCACPVKHSEAHMHFFDMERWISFSLGGLVYQHSPTKASQLLLQVPSEKLLLVGLEGPNTIWGGTWSAREQCFVST